MIPYIGDLSRNDAVLLKNLAEQADRILEFGVGASTQIFAAYAKGSVTSVDTDPTWIDRTNARLDALAASGVALRPVVFVPYADFEPAGAYDLVFVDGIDELRLEFALKTWDALAPWRSMAFHDTRRTKPHGPSKTSDIENVATVLARHALEIDHVLVNTLDSNITLVRKRTPLALEDWNVVEGRTPEQIGIAND